MPSITETIIYMIAFLAGPPAFHYFAVWYARSFRWIISSVAIQIGFFAYWYSQQPNGL